MGEPKGTFYVIPHTHWEGAVFQTREAYLEMGLPNILRALALLQAHPSYRFTLDQVCYVKPFLERYPQHAALFRRLVAEGRLAIVGGTDVMADVNMPAGESFVRQMLYGKGYYQRELGLDVTVSWQLDTFGHHAQMPQLLRQAGYRSFWFFRGVPGWDTPAEFLWEGLDGTRIPAFWLPHGYAVTYGSPAVLPEFAAFMTERYDSLAPFARGPVRVGPGGADVCEPEPNLPQLSDAFNARPDSPFHLRIATPAEYEEAVGDAGDWPTVRGELNPIFQGAYSSRIELKQRLREIERLLTSAEKLGVVLNALGAQADDGDLWPAWEPALFNQAHDLMSGVMTDGVYADTVRGYDMSARLAAEALDRRLHDYAARIDTSGDGVPIVVVNALGWDRTDIVTLTVGFADEAALSLAMVDPEGRDVAVQILEAQRYAGGALLEARIAFVARDVPAMGHAVYRLLPVGTGAPGDARTGEPASPVLENEIYRLELGPSGSIRRLVVKADGHDALQGPANVIAQEEDRGDLWEPYRPLDGGSRVAMKEVHGVPGEGARLSTDGAGEGGSLATGPVVSECSARGRIGESTFETTVRLYTGLRRIDIRTTLTNNDRFVRYRVLFPTTTGDGPLVQEIPFGAIERPAGIEFPAQNWVHCGSGGHGMALLNRGLPGNNVADGTMMLSLLRSTRIVAYGFGGGYGPGMSSDTGLAVGQDFTFDYALVPCAGDWRDAGVHRDGWEFNHPLLAATAAPHAGPLPARWGLVKVSDPSVVVSAMRTGVDGSAMVRVYEATGRPVADVRLTFSCPVASAHESDLIERPGAALRAEGNEVRLSLRPFEIRTVGLRLGGA